MSGHRGWTTDDTAVAGPNAAGEKRNAGTPCTEEPRVKAFALTGPDQPASLVELPAPELPPDGVGVRVGAASVNGFDVFQANGYLLAMMEHVFPTVIGRDFAGVVEAVGAGRSDVAAGDEVLGFIPSAPPLHDGTYAERIAPAGVVLARKQAGLSFEVAAAIPLAAVTALDSVEVQLAAQRGATVIATAKAGDDEGFVREFGASETVDYTAGDGANAIRSRFPDGNAALIDVVNRDEAFAAMVALVRDGGRIATTLGAADVEDLAARDVRATNIMGAPTPEKLTVLADQVAAGGLRLEIQQTYPLAEAPAALATFAAGTRGKIVLTVE